MKNKNTRKASKNNVSRGMVCNLPFWTCQECNKDTAKRVRVCECKNSKGEPSAYRRDIGIVNEHRPVIIEMLAQGYVFPGDVAAWAKRTA